MRKSIRETQLVNARHACLELVQYALGKDPVIILGEPHREHIADLIEQFGRLDKKEQRQIAQGKKGAKFGKLGGRPRKRRQPEP